MLKISSHSHPRLARGSLHSSLPLLRLLDRDGPLSQTTAARRLSMTTGTGNLHFQRLESEHLVRRADHVRGAKGRPTIVWDINRRQNAVLVLVFDVPFFQATLLDFAAQPLLEQRLDLSRARHAEDIADAINAFSRNALDLAAHDGIRVRQVVGGFPGLLDPADGTVLHAVNFPALDGLNLARLFAAKRLPAWSASLGLCFFFGETADLPDDATTLVVHWDLGVGMIVGRGENIVSQQFDGDGAPQIPEAGHICIAPGGRDCRCGRKGCLEAYTGGQAMLSDLAGGDIRTLGDLLAALQDRRQGALVVARRAARTLARHMAWPTQFFGVERIVVTGPMSVAFDLLATAFRQGLADTLPPEIVNSIAVQPSPDPRGSLRTGACHLATRLVLDPASANRLPRSPAKLG